MGGSLKMDSQDGYDSHQQPAQLGPESKQARMHFLATRAAESVAEVIRASFDREFRQECLQRIYQVPNTEELKKQLYHDLISIEEKRLARIERQKQQQQQQ